MIEEKTIALLTADGWKSGVWKERGNEWIRTESAATQVIIKDSAVLGRKVLTTVEQKETRFDLEF